MAEYQRQSSEPLPPGALYLRQIADRLGVARSTLDGYRFRGQMPLHDGRDVNGHPWWLPSTLAPWRQEFAEDGHSLSAIARAAGLSRQGVKKIIDRRSGAMTTTTTAWLSTSESMPGADPGVSVQRLYADGTPEYLAGSDITDLAEGDDFDRQHADRLLAEMGYRRTSDWIASGGQWGADVEHHLA